MTYVATPKHKIICLGVVKFTILVDPSLVNFTKYSVCVIYPQDWKRKGFKRVNVLSPYDVYCYALRQETLWTLSLSSLLYS